ncbi:aminopeptidase [Spirochaetota bacterium]
MALNKTQLGKFADVLLWGLETARTKPYKAYDVILVRYDLPALPLAEVMFRKLMKRKFNVVARSLGSPIMEKDFFEYSDKKQRTFIGKWEPGLVNELNGNIFLSAPESLTHLKDIDPKRMNESAVARKPLRKILERREERGQFGWTLCTYPTEEPAKRAGLSFKEYKNQIVKACFLNDKDPVKRWKDIFNNSIEIKKWLNSMSVKTLHLESKSCDLKISMGERRKFIGISGHNIPSFEIFTSPDFRGTEGVYYSNLPSYKSGNLVNGVKLEFTKGNVVKASAKQGNNFLNQMVKMDNGAKRIGEFSLTDKRFSKINKFMADTLFDENFGGSYGNSHIAIGMSYSDTYSGNPASLTPKKKRDLGFNDSALHWDLVNTEDKKVAAILKNGRSVVIYEKGMFKY